MRYVCQATVVALSILAPSVMFGQSTQGLSITNYQFVSEQRISLTQSDVTYKASLANNGSSTFSAVTATVTSLASSVQVVPGQGNLHFAQVFPGSQVNSSNTFTILVDRTVPFDFSSLQWTFNTPVANAGPNQTVGLNTTVTLNGSGSTNPSGSGGLTYSWKITAKPFGSTAQLSNSTSVTPTFVVDLAGNYTITLTVTNNNGSDTASVMVSTDNSPPVANAGPNQTVALGSTVFLNGSGSTDVDGNPLTYAWTLIQQPANSTSTLIGANTVAPSFVIYTSGTYVVQLIVNDGFVNSTPATVTINTQNTPPVANAGSNQTVNVGALVQLSGAGSTDVDGNTLTYQWSLLNAPPHSTAALSNATIVNPTFTADLPGTYVVQLIVNDGFVNSTPTTVTITTNGLQAPSANAGPGQTVDHNTTVTLAGSGVDPQGLQLTYVWSLTTKPSGSAAVLSSTSIQNPTFFADKAGNYVAQLIVNDGYLSSAPSTVAISTTNTAPVANAGQPQTVTVGNNVILDGSGSTDADGDPLTYLWSFTTSPDPNASLNGANTKNPIFQVNVAGVYVVQLIVSDPYTSSTPTTVQITAQSVPTITLTPNPMNLTNVAGTLTVTLSAPAGSNGVVINLFSGNVSAAGVPSTVTVPANATSTTATVTPGSPGTASISATANGYQSGTTTVNVAAPAITLTVDSGTLGLTHTMNGTVTLNNPAPDGGVTVALATNPTGVVTVPSTVAIAGGATTGSFTVTSVADGTTTITGSLSGYTSGTVNVTVNNLGAISLPATTNIGTGPAVSYPVSLVTAAPQGGVTITLSSSNLNAVTISPATVMIAAGATTPAVQPQVTGVNFGSATITATAPGFNPGSGTVTVKGTLQFTQTALTMPSNGVQNLTLTLSSAAPAGGLTINLSSDNTTVATVPTTVNLAAGATSVPVPVTAGSVSGTTTIHASMLPALPDTTSIITVAVVGNLSLPSNATVSLGASSAFPVTLSTAAPAGGVTVSLSSSDTTKVTISPATVTIAAGSVAPAVQPQVTGVTLGSANITATTTGYTSATQAVKVTATASFSPGTVTITGTGTQSVTLTLSAAAPAGGVVFALSSDAVGTATVPSTATIAAGSTSTTVTITGVAVGSTVVHASSLPSVADTTVNVNVVSSGPITLPANVTVGPSQSANFQVTLPSAAPPGGVTVALTSSDTTKVTVTASVTIPAGSMSPAVAPQVTGVNYGSATITATAAGFTPGSQTVQVGSGLTFSPNTATIAGTSSTNITLTLSAPAPAGGLTINLSSSNTAAATVPATVTFAANATTVQVPVTGTGIGTATITASSGALNISNTTAAITVVSPGTIILPANVVISLGRTASYPVTLPTAATGTVTVALSSSDTTKVTISPSTVTIAAGQTAPATQPTITSVGLGTANISAAASTYTTGVQSVQVTAVAAFSPNTLSIVGSGSHNLTLTLSAAAPAGGVIINTSSDNTTVATVPATVTFAPGTTSVTVPVNGVAVGTANIHASAVPYIADTTAAVTVSSPIVLLQNVTVSPGTSSNFTVSLSSPAPYGGVFITLSSGNTSAVTVSPSSILIPQGGTQATSPKVTGVSFGTAVISATAYNYLSATSTVVTTGTLSFVPNTQQITGTGKTQGITLSLSSAAPAGGLTINLSSSNTAIATVPPTVTIAAGTATVNVPVTSVATGTTTLNASDLPILANATATTTVVPAPAVVLPSFASVGQYNSVAFPVSVSTPAPAGGVTITLTSSDNTVLTITPSSVFVAAGATTPATTPQINGIGLGPVNITGTAPNYQTAVLSGVYVSDSIHVSLAPNVTVPLGQSTTLTVNLSNPASPGGVTVNLTSSDTSKVTITATAFVAAGQTTPAVQPVVTGINVGTSNINATANGYSSAATQTVTVTAAVVFSPTNITITGTGTQNLTLTLSAAAPAGGVTVNTSSSNTGVATVPATVTFPAGQTTVQVPVTGVANGTATINASATTIPNATASVTVGGAGGGTISVPANTNLNLGQTSALNVSLPSAPASAVTVSLVSSDTSKVTVSPASVTIAAGATTPATQPQVTGVNVGSANVTASATGYTSGVSAAKVSATVSWPPSALSITGVGNTQIATLTLSASAPSGGLTVNLSSDNTSVATVPATAIFAGGSTTTTVTVTGSGAGTTTLHVNGTNIADSTTSVTVTAVSGPTINLQSGLTIAPGVPTAFGVSLSAPAPSGGVFITFSSGNTSTLTVSPSSFLIPQGATAPTTTPKVTGVTFGVANVSAAATGYTTAVQPVTVSGTLSFSPSTVSLTSGAQQNITLSLTSAAPAAMTIGLSSSNTSVATVPASIVLPAGANSITVKVTAVGAGSATISASYTGVTGGSATVNVVQQLAITTSSLANAQLSAAYTQTLGATGGTTPYNWTLTSGTLPAGLTLTGSTGVISGTPTALVTNTPLTFKVTDSGAPTAQTASVNLTLTVALAPLTVTTSSLPNGTVGTAYSQTLAATGGTTPYGWQVSSGTLPAGLSLTAATGVISGTPTAIANATPLTFKVSDASSPTQTATTTGITLTIVPAQLGITTTGALPAGKISVAYTTTLAATGGTTPYTWQLASGTMPAGLSLNASTGVISGTPQGPVVSNTPLTFTLTDSTSPTHQVVTSGTLTMTIGAAPLVLSTTGALPGAKLTVAYSTTLSVSGGTTPYSWTLTSGTMPAGLTLNSATGVISGTPSGTVVTNTPLTFQVTDSSSPVQTATSTGITLSVAPAPLTITTSSLPNGQLTQAYNQSLAATGGTTPYTWSLTSGPLPTGLTLNTSTGAITGTPTGSAQGYPVTFKVTDTEAPAQTATVSFTLTIVPAQLAILTTSLPNAQVNAAYSQTVQASGGVTPYSWQLTSGNMPAGLTLNSSTGVLSGTPTGPAVNNLQLAFKVTDSASPAATATATISLTISPTLLTISTSGALPAGRISASYSTTLGANGGTTPYSWQLTSGTLPAGLTLTASTGVISGTPQGPTVTNTPLTFKVTDSSPTPQNQSVSVTMTIGPAPLNITTATLPNAQIGVAYSQSLAVTGGTTPYSWQLTSGTMPAGLSLSTAGVVSGTPSGSPTNTSLTFTVTDNESPAQNASVTMTFTVTPPQLTIMTTTVPNGQVAVPYSQTISATGGITPYTWTLNIGTLPQGLTFSSAGVISGTPTATASNVSFQVKVTDTAQTVVYQNLTMSIAPPALVISTPAGPLPNGQVGNAYSQTLAATGGTPGYTWSITSGTLPAGLTLTASTGAISGTPTGPAVNNTPLTFKVTDSGPGTPQTQTVAVTLTILPTALGGLTTSLPNAKISTAYSQALTVTGGTSPYSWQLTSGTMPAGLTLTASTGVISGTPTGTAVNNLPLTFKVTDSSPTPQTASTTGVTLTVLPTALSGLTTSLANGKIGTAYSQTLAVTGGTTPYSWQLTAGQMPAGLTLNSTTGVISGTPTGPAANNVPLTFTVTDSSPTPQNASTTGVTLTILPTSLTGLTTSLPSGTVGTAYSATLAVSGGTTPYSWALTSGQLPAGLTLTASTGVISGTPTTPVTSTPLTFTVTDSSPTPQNASTTGVSLTIAPATLVITTSTLPNGNKGVAYSQTLALTGGTAPFTWSVNSGNLPAGLTLVASTGVISGTPTQTGGNTATFKVVDSGSPSHQTATSGSIGITIVPAPLVINTSSLPNGQAGVTYTNTTMSASGGTTPYTWTITSGTLPAGLAMSTAGLISGTPLATTTATMTFQVADSSLPQMTQTVTLSLYVAPPPVIITTFSLPSASLTTPYYVQFGATGGTAPYSWKTTSGSLPSGLTFNAAGQITGTPTSTGTFRVTYQVTDSSTPGQTSSTSLNLNVTGVPTGPAIGVTSVNVGQNLEVPITVTIPQQSSNVNVTLTSSDITKALLSLNKNAPGSGSVTVTFVAGTTQVGLIYVQSLASSGTTTIVANAPGFSNGVGGVTLYPSGFILTGPNGSGSTSFTTSQGVASTLTLTSARLDSSFNFAEAQVMSGAMSPSVNVTTGSQQVGTVSPSPVTFPAGSSTVTTTFTATSSGLQTQATTNITANTPAGFSAPNGGLNTLTAFVNAPGIMPQNVSVGQSLETTTYAPLSGATTQQGVIFTITSSDPSKVLFADNPGDPGSASITVNTGSVTGAVRTPSFYVYGVNITSQPVSYTVSGGGFPTGTGYVTVTPSALLIQGPFGLGSNFTTTTQAIPSTLTIFSAQLDSNHNYVGMQNVSGAASATAGLTVTPALGSVPATATIAGGTGSTTVQFQPSANGNAEISVTEPSGFSNSNEDQSVGVTISSPGIAITDSVTVGQNLAVEGSLILGQIPQSPLIVTLTSNNPSALLLAMNATDPGSASIQITIPAGGQFANYYIYGVGSSGTTGYTAVATGYSNGVATSVALAPAGVVIVGPLGIDPAFQQPYSISLSGGGTLSIPVATCALNSNFGYMTEEALAGGQSLSVSLFNQSFAIGSITNPVTITAGNSETTVTFTPAQIGSTTIFLAGANDSFNVSSDNNNVQVNVTQ